MRVLTYVAFSVLILIFQSGCFSESDSNESTVQKSESSLNVESEGAPTPTKVIYENTYNDTIEPTEPTFHDEDSTLNAEKINSNIETNSTVMSSSDIDSNLLSEETSSTTKTTNIVVSSSDINSSNLLSEETSSTNIVVSSSNSNLVLEEVNSTNETNSTLKTLAFDGNQTIDANTSDIKIIEKPIEIVYNSGNIGKFVASVSGIEYSCDGLIKSTDAKGLFNCESTPIYFSLGNISLGNIQVFTDDYLLYPQDLLNLSRGAGLHPEVTKIAILLQSLDSDANPNNGISIHKDIIELINQEVLQVTDIKAISLINLKNIIEKVIVTNLEYSASSKLRLVTLEEAQDHMLSIISTEYQSPIQP